MGNGLFRPLLGGPETEESSGLMEEDGKESDLLDEFSVTFPPSDVVFGADDGATPPLALLFGWAGCNDRYLAKYSQIYDQKGCITMRYTASVAFGRLHSGYDLMGERLLGALEDLDLDQLHPVIVHVFSGNGGALFCSLCKAAQRRTVETGTTSFTDNIRGIVFDSYPAQTSAYQSASAISFAVCPPQVVGYWRHRLLVYAMTAYLSVRQAYTWFRCLFNPALAAQSHTYRRLLALDLPRRQLYLYSKGDVICDYRSTEAFIAEQRRRGCETRAKCWEKSPHCELLRYDREEYVKETTQFLDWVMAGRAGEQPNGEDDTSSGTLENGFEKVHEETIDAPMGSSAM